MDPELSGFALGLLLGAAKVGLIGTVAFGIAWWRSRKRVRELEAELNAPALTEERLEHLEQGLDYVASQLDRLTQSLPELGPNNRERSTAFRELPPGERIPNRPVTPT